VPVVTGMSLLLGVLQASPCSPTAGAAMTMMTGLSSLGADDVEPLVKKACRLSFLLVSSRYGVVCWFTPLPFFLSLL
jgi:hypothetical protein